MVANTLTFTSYHIEKLTIILYIRTKLEIFQRTNCCDFWAGKDSLGCNFNIKTKNFYSLNSIVRKTQRQTTVWEKTFIKYILGKDQLSKIFLKNSYNSIIIRDNLMFKIQAKDLNRFFSKEQMMGNKPMKCVSTPLVIRER